MVGTFRYGSKKLTHAVSHADGWWGPLPLVQKGQPMQWMQQVLVQKGQLTQCTHQILVVGTVTFHAKWSTHAVGYTADAVDAVGFGAKRSTHTVYSANMGGGDHYL